VIVNKAEARQLLAAKIAELRRHSYSDLLRFMEPEGLEVTGPSGSTYQLEVEPSGTTNASATYASLPGSTMAGGGPSSQ
jgi:hypothetical protein